MPSAKTTKCVFHHYFHLVCFKSESIIFRFKSHSKAPTKKPASEILTEEASPQGAPSGWVFSFFLWVDLLQVLTKMCLSAYPVKVGNKRRAPVTSDSEMFISIHVQSSMNANLFYLQWIYWNPNKAQEGKDGWAAFSWISWVWGSPSCHCFVCFSIFLFID